MTTPYELSPKIKELINNEKPTRDRLYQALKSVNPGFATGQSRATVDRLVQLLNAHFSTEVTADAPPPPNMPTTDVVVSPLPQLPGLEAMVQTAGLETKEGEMLEEPNVLELPEGMEPPEGFVRLRTHRDIPYCIAKNGGDPERPLTTKEAFWLEDVSQVLRILGPKEKHTNNKGKVIRHDPYKRARKALRHALKQLAWSGIQVLNPVRTAEVVMPDAEEQPPMETKKPEHVHGPGCSHHHHEAHAHA